MRPTKPRLEEFLKTFQEQVIAVNKAYASSKQHLEQMMAQFAKDGDDEDMTEKQLPLLNDEDIPGKQPSEQISD